MTEPRHDLDAERVVLGSMMVDPEAVDVAAGMLVPGSFYSARHASVFAAIVGCRADGEPTEPIAVARRLGRDDMLGKIGGAPALLEMVQAVPVSASVGYYAGAVRDLAVLRDLQVVTAHGQQIAAHSDDPAEAIDRVRAELDGLGMPGSGDDLKRLGDYATEALDAIERAGMPEAAGDALPTGLLDLDRLFGGGLRGGQVVVIAGRPSMGKSLLARVLARHAVFDLKVPAVLFTMEMSPIEVFHCVLSAELSIPLHAITSGRLSDDDWARIARWVGENADAPLFIDHTPGISMAELRSKSARLRKSHGLGLVIVDYLQLMSSSKRSENRQQEVSELSRSFKMFAVELDVPTVLVAQLNRGPEMRSDKRPQLSDLRESGSIEQDANVVILVYRDDYYDKQSPRRGEADLIVAKNRGGPQDTVTVASQLHYSRFTSMAVNL